MLLEAMEGNTAFEVEDKFEKKKKASTREARQEMTTALCKEMAVEGHNKIFKREKHTLSA